MTEEEGETYRRRKEEAVGVVGEVDEEASRRSERSGKERENRRHTHTHTHASGCRLSGSASGARLEDRSLDPVLRRLPASVSSFQ